LGSGEPNDPAAGADYLADGTGDSRAETRDDGGAFLAALK